MLSKKYGKKQGFPSVSQTQESSILQDAQKVDMELQTSPVSMTQLPTTLRSYFGVLPKLNDNAVYNKSRESPFKRLKDDSLNRQKTNMKDTSTQQLHLNLGQKNGFLLECSICSMAYNPSCPEDQKIHKQYHKKHTLASANIYSD